MAAVAAAVASLAWQQLQALPTSLLWDLAWLVHDGVQQQDGQQVQLFGGLLRHYVQVSQLLLLVVGMMMTVTAAASSPLVVTQLFVWGVGAFVSKRLVEVCLDRQAIGGLLERVAASVCMWAAPSCDSKGASSDVCCCAGSHGWRPADTLCAGDRAGGKCLRPPY
jgi:hypothetical protein